MTLGVRDTEGPKRGGGDRSGESLQSLKGSRVVPSWLSRHCKWHCGHREQSQPSPKEAKYSWGQHRTS